MKLGHVVRGGRTIIGRVWRADRAWSRMRGLLGHPQLRSDAQEALWLTPCNNVHTLGMRYALDIVFLDRAGCVLDFQERVQPRRMRLCWAARHTVELASGGIAALAITVGEQWQWFASREP